MKNFLEQNKHITSNIILIVFATFLLIYNFTSNTASDDIVVIYDSAKETKNVSGTENKYKIYLITMNMVDDFWKSIDSGCKQAIDEVDGITYKWIGPDLHEDNLQNICINQALEDGANAILIASSSPTGINDSLKKADEAGVKIIYVDNAADYDGVAFLSTDNKLAGKIAAETMQKALSEVGIHSGNIATMSNKDTTISTNLRVEGFNEQLKDTNFTVAENFYMEDNPQRIVNFVRENPDFVAFFGSNEMTTLALGKAVKDSESKKIIIGFDTSDAVLSLVNDNTVYAVMQQNPKLMGYKGIKIAIEALNGSYTEKNTKIDTGVTVIDKDTL